MCVCVCFGVPRCVRARVRASRQQLGKDATFGLVGKGLSCWKHF